MSHVVGSDYGQALHFLVDTLEQAISKHGSNVTYHHLIAEVAEAATRELPAGTHYLRNAVDEADRANAERKREQKEWKLAEESGFYSVPSIVKPVREPGASERWGE